MQTQAGPGPRNADACTRFGIARYMEGAVADAIAAFEDALRIAPAHRIAGLNLGIALTAVGECDEAAAVLASMLRTHSDFAVGWVALGDALRESGRAEEAEDAARRGLQLDPSIVEGYLLLGQLSYQRARFPDAQTLFAHAASLAPNRAEPRMNLAVIAHGLGRVQEAIAHGEAAVALEPDDALAHLNLGMSLLLNGQYRRGFAELEWRTRDPRAASTYALLGAVPLWTGAPLRGGSLLVTLDQGLGDFVLWSRLFAQAQARGAYVVVECPPPLFALFRAVDGVDEVLCGACPADELPAFAAHVPLCSLPHVLGIDAPLPPGRQPRVDPARVAAYRERFAATGARTTVGIVWAGDPSHGLDRFRSCALAEFATIAEVPGVACVSLQKGPRAADAASAPFALTALGGELHDFAETAAALTALDLVITVDTSVAHVAAALGRPVWLMHGFGKYWLWGVDGERSPWYPSVRMFRQHTPHEWDELFADVRAALEIFRP